MRRSLLRSSLNALLSSSRTSLILASEMRVDVRDDASRPGPGTSQVVDASSLCSSAGCGREWAMEAVGGWMVKALDG